MGIAPDIIYSYNDSTGILDQIESTANPLHFASPDGYHYLETSPGRTINDRNFVTVTAGASPTKY